MEGMSVKDDDTDAKSTSSDYEDAEEMPAQSVPTLPRHRPQLRRRGKRSGLASRVTLSAFHITLQSKLRSPILST